MAADEQGNDLGAVAVPITGMAAYAPLSPENKITEAELAASPLVLPAAFKKLGLYKQDGGPTPTRETGDPIEFFQIGYKLSGEGTRGLTIGLAENNPTVVALIEGVEPDEHGVYKVSSTLPDNRFILFSSLRYRGGLEERQVGVASITAVEPDQAERGSVKGAAVTFTWQEHDLFDGSPFWQWGPAVPGGAVTVTGVTAGTPGTFSPAGATPPSSIADLRALGSLGQTTAWATGQYVEYGSGPKAHWNGTDWATGEAA
ncbi:hypothetical protein [Leucobacter massiliensis]|uniref:Uncharacterized protein n=1 Tax=Leucobacter massiliensis TaxID=1686285 RepID=A0A2S9QMV4_9MICO|nr:hypothetical protein [Leucobacter massiliensis]PRI10918.1 hypothetical protein B4915_08520 [Leucobacter massiliensis]